MPAPAHKRFAVIPKIRDACLSCQECELGCVQVERNGYAFDPHVFGDPYIPKNCDDGAQFMVVGPGVGLNEAKTKKAISGTNLTELLCALGLAAWKLYNLEEVIYTTNIVKCYSPEPTIEQIQKCERFLKLELAVVQPLLIITLGPQAFEAICDYKFSDRVGKITNSKYTHPNTVLPHLSYYKVYAADMPGSANFRQQMKLVAGIINYHMVPF